MFIPIFRKHGAPGNRMIGRKKGGGTRVIPLQRKSGTNLQMLGRKTWGVWTNSTHFPPSRFCIRGSFSGRISFKYVSTSTSASSPPNRFILPRKLSSLKCFKLPHSMHVTKFPHIHQYRCPNVYRAFMDFMFYIPQVPPLSLVK